MHTNYDKKIIDIFTKVINNPKVRIVPTRFQYETKIMEWKNASIPVDKPEYLAEVDRVKRNLVSRIPLLETGDIIYKTLYDVNGDGIIDEILYNKKIDCKKFESVIEHENKN
jgi:hypothetical protein